MFVKVMWRGEYPEGGGGAGARPQFAKNKKGRERETKKKEERKRKKTVPLGRTSRYGASTCENSENSGKTVRRVRGTRTFFPPRRSPVDARRQKLTCTFFLRPPHGICHVDVSARNKYSASTCKYVSRRYFIVRL